MHRFGTVCLFILCALGASPDQWTRFRGPNGSGVGDYAGLPDRLPGEGAGLRWRIAIPPGHSSPIVAEGRVFLTAFENQQLFTYAVRAADGKVLWKVEAPRTRNDKVDQRNSPASPSPVVDGGRVFVFFHHYGLLAYDLDGKEKWRSPLGPFQNVYGMGASPILVDGKLILVCDQSFNSFIAAFDPNTGKQLWKTPRPEALSGHSTPIAMKVGSESQVIAPASFRMDVYSVRSGEAAWWVTGLPSEMKSTPVLVDLDGEPRLFVSGFNIPQNDPGKQVQLPPFDEVLGKFDANKDGKLAVTESPDDKTKSYFPYIDLNGDGFLDAEDWKKYQLMMGAENGLLSIRPGGKGDVTVERMAWKFHRGIPQLPSPVVYRGIVYMVSDRGILTTLDAATGKMYRQGRLTGTSEEYYASPVAGDGKIYFAGKNGKITVLGAGPEPPTVSETQLEGEVYATPALTPEGIIVRTTKWLYSFQSAK